MKMIGHLDNSTELIWMVCYLIQVRYNNILGFILASDKDGFSAKGGHFVWPLYGVGADLGKCDGVTLLLWRGKHDPHATMQCITPPAFTTIGSSVQISHQLLIRTQINIANESIVAKERVMGKRQCMNDLRQRNNNAQEKKKTRKLIRKRKNKLFFFVFAFSFV